jgi:cyclic pyranopterin phosphate synthase
MVDVGHKEKTARVARARALVRMQRETLERLASGDTPKGDVLAVVRVAAIQAAKRTSEWIPLCHPLSLTRVAIEITLGDEDTVTIDATVETHDRTGVEMEAMVAASAGALTLYDMLKGIDRAITFEVTLLEKRGGKSGYVAPISRP